MTHGDGGRAEQQGDGQPENIEDLQDQRGGSAMSGRRPERTGEGGGHVTQGTGEAPEAGSAARSDE